MEASVRSHVVAHLPGDGIGPEVTAVARDLVDQAGQPARLQRSTGATARSAPTTTCAPARSCRTRSWPTCARPTPSCSARSAARRCRPGVLERGLLLRLRFELDLYVNLRPARLRPGVEHGRRRRPRLRRRPGEHRGPVRGRRRHRAPGHLLRDGDRGVAQHPGRRRALHPLRGRAGREAHRQAHPGAQDQRAGATPAASGMRVATGGRRRPRACSSTTPTSTRPACTWSTTRAGST